MQELSGIAASPGIAIGPVRVATSSASPSEPFEGGDQVARFHEAVERSREQISGLRDRIKASSPEEAEIFDTHLLLIEDPMFFDEIESRISDDRANAEQAVSEVTSEVSAMFEGLEDDYLRARAFDVRDIGARILRNLKGDLLEMSPGSVWVSSEMFPSEVAAAHESGMIALVSEEGALNSHAAILARSLGIPAVFGLKGIAAKLVDGEMLIVDGDAGTVISGSDGAVQAEYRAKASSALNLDGFAFLRGKIKAAEIRIKANIGSADEADKAFSAGADGIGLVRTEFLFADREQMPNEEEQFKAYVSIIKAAGGKPVAIRTLDAGSDKPLKYLDMPVEANPSLGLRGLRLSLSMPDVLKIQLRAILRAAAQGDASLFFPMVTNVDEMEQALVLVEQASGELQAEKTIYRQVKVGAMIEVPAAAINAAKIAAHADFLSLGTNDLVQYTLAADRINSSVAHLYNELDPAVLSLIEMVVNAGREFDRPVCVCGEMASNIKSLPSLLEIGVREFSISAASIKRIRTVFESLME
ncbi:MAG TPA: phosphoenolpyruvate--protein phosphotransferase [Armatimonadota bacterium]|jgi:phosphotransferase system enzyme I (PtsI)